MSEAQSSESSFSTQHTAEVQNEIDYDDESIASTSTTTTTNNTPPTTRTLENVMESCVAATSRASYLCTNRRLVIYLYKKATEDGCAESRQFFKDDTFDVIENAVTTNPDDKNILHKTITSILKLFTNHVNNPFNLQALTFQVVTNYMLGRQKKNQDGTIGTLSTSTFEGIRSSYAHLLRIAGEKPHPSLSRMRQFMGGMKRTVAKDILTEGMSCEPGKSPMSFPVYKRICLILSKSQHPECIFARCWLTLEWNLISRADSCAKTHINHIEWRDDCLIIFLPITKTNQEGVDRSIPWHVFANPNAPEICFIHALGVYLFTNPQLLMGNSRLFPGTRQYKRYVDIISKTIIKHKADLEQYGSVTNLGSHSIRKGAASYCASGSTVSPPIVSICLRANWTIGGSKERYLKFENAGDQFVGRMVCGLDATSPSFAVSPPFFHQEGEEDIVGAFLNENLIIAETNVHLVKMILATICYHWDWYSNTIHPLNPFKSSIVYSKLTQPILQLSSIAYPWQDDRPVSCPKFSGIPPHVTIVTMLQKIKENQGEASDVIIASIVKELEDRGTFGGFSEQRMRVMMEGMVQSISQVVQRDSSATREGNTHQNNNTSTRGANGFNYFLWGGQMHMLPQDWVLPHGMNLRACFGLWYIGIHSDKVPPIVYIRRPNEFAHLKEGKKRYCDMKFLFRVVERFGRERNLWIRDDVRGWNESLVQRLYDGVATSLLGYSLQRFHAKAWGTIVNRLRTVERQRNNNNT